MDAGLARVEYRDNVLGYRMPASRILGLHVQSIEIMAVVIGIARVAAGLACVEYRDAGWGNGT